MLPSGVALIWLLIAFVFGGGFGQYTARKRVERIEREARKRVQRAERERDFAEQLMHDLLNEAVDKKLIQAKIALLAAAKGVSSGATEIVDVARTGFRELRSRVSFWEKQPDPEILSALKRTSDAA
jgi:hypothetical protein